LYSEYTSYPHWTPGNRLQSVRLRNNITNFIKTSNVCVKSKITRQQHFTAEQYTEQSQNVIWCHCFGTCCSWVQHGLTPCLTNYRSFQRLSSEPISLLVK